MPIGWNPFGYSCSKKYISFEVQISVFFCRDVLINIFFQFRDPSKSSRFNELIILFKTVKKVNKNILIKTFQALEMNILFGFNQSCKYRETKRDKIAIRIGKKHKDK